MTSKQKATRFLENANMEFGYYEYLVKSLLEAGYAADKFAGAGTEIQNAQESHRAVSGQGDATAQDILLKGVFDNYTGIEVLCEEKADHPRVLDKNDPKGILTGEKIIIDPVDSSVRFGADIGGWCSGVGMIRDGVPVFGAVFTPATNNGILVVSQDNHITVIERDGCKVTLLRSLPKAELKNSLVYLGVDTLQYPAIAKFLPELTTKVRAVNTSGSGILGATYVSIGRGIGVLQTPQRIWDIIPTYHALKTTERNVVFYRINPTTRTPKFFNELDYQAYCYARPNRVGMIAGDVDAVDLLIKLLSNADPLVKEDEKLKD